MDKEELKERVSDMPIKLSMEEILTGQVEETISKVLDLIDQLDEPEVLSQEWIDKNKTSIDRKLDGTPIYKVREELLQNLLVPKQELLSQEWIDEHLCHEDEYDFDYIDPDDLQNVLIGEPEKVVVPKFVGEWIKDNYSEYERTNCKEFVIWDTFKTLFNFPGHMDDSMIDFLNNRADLFVRAVTDGYTVEEEKKYYVLDSKDIPLLERANNYTYKTTTSLSIQEDGRDNSKFELTEQEIKDYDERYLAFKKPVEELEE